VIPERIIFVSRGITVQLKYTNVREGNTATHIDREELSPGTLIC